MTQTSVVKTVGGVTTKITTMTRTTTSSQQILQQQQKQQQQQQLQTKQKLITTKPPYMTNARNDRHISTSNFQKSHHYEEPAPIIKQQESFAEDICVRCNRTVYKMVAVIAEHQVWHRSCFRCNECNMQLNRHSKVDSFQIHGGVLYCNFHFKQLFRKKDDDADITPVAVKTRSPMPETISKTKETTEEMRHNVGIKRGATGATVLSKMEKFHTKGMDVGDIDLKTNEKECKNDPNDDDSLYSENFDDDTDVDLMRAKRVLSKVPLTYDNVNEIKDKFEAGMDQGREVRRMERKQEVQDVRSRVYLGKQARTKEKYENALAKLETNPKLRNKGLLMAYELDNVKAAAEKTRNAKLKFETGTVYHRRNSSFDREGSVTSQISNKVSERMQMLANRHAQDETIKSNAKVKIMEKPDISNQCKFFENCHPEKQKGYAIKIDGINIGGVKMGGSVEKAKSAYIGRIKKSKTVKNQQYHEENENTVDMRSTQQNQTPSKITNGKSVNTAQNSVRTQTKQRNVNRF